MSMQNLYDGKTTGKKRVSYFYHSEVRTGIRDIERGGGGDIYVQ